MIIDKKTGKKITVEEYLKQMDEGKPKGEVAKGQKKPAQKKVEGRPDIEVKYGKEWDATWIRATLPNVGWYMGNGIPFRLPEGATYDNARELAEKEYDEGFYREAEDSFTEAFENIPGSFYRGLEQRAQRKLPEKVDVLLTRYGADRSCSDAKSNWIILNVAMALPGSGAIQSFKRELIRMMVGGKAKRGKFDVKQTEDLVTRIYRNLGG